MTTELSIIMPLYNTESYVQQSLLSVLNQSYKNFELIIVNDGSTDNSLHIAKECIYGYKNTKLINLSTNHGAGYARNQGLKVAKGNIIGFIDSDDWIDTNFYSCLIDNMQRFQSDISIAGIQDEFISQKNGKTRYMYKYENEISSQFALELLARTHNTDIYITPIVNNKIYKRKLFFDNNLHFIDNNYYEDDIITFWLLFYANRISICSSTNYHYLQRESSIMHTFSNKHMEDLFKAFKTLKSDILNINAINIKNIYYKFFQKCFSGIIENIFTLESDINQQELYLNKLITLLKKNFNDNEIIKCIGLDSIKRLYF